MTNVPPMQGLEALVHRVSAEFGTVDTQPPEVAPRQWLGFIRWTMHSAGNANGLLTLVNLDDGRACGPWDGTDLGRPLPDARGVPVTTRRAASQVPGGGSLGLIDPTTGAFREFAGDRDGQFFMSGNGETVLTFSVPRAEDAAGDADADLVCFDLTQDPPARVRIDGVVPGHRITRQYTRNADGGWGYRPFTYERADGVGGVALSPDGRTLAVSESWRDNRRVGPLGVTFYDTRTGRRKGAAADYGPVPDGLKGTAAGDTGAFRLTFSRDSRHLSFDYSARQRFVWAVAATPGRSLNGPAPVVAVRTVNVETGACLAPGDRTRHGGWAAWSGVLPGLSPNGFGMRAEHARVPVIADGPMSRLLAADAAGQPDRAAPGANQTPPGPQVAGVHSRNYAEFFDFWVTDADGTDLCPRRPLLREGTGELRYGTGSQFVPGTTGLAWVTQAVPYHEVCWYDYATDESRVLGHVAAVDKAGGRVILYPREKGFVTLRHNRDDGEATVSLWDLPPRRPPWLWSVPAGVALGVLLTAAGVRLRRGRDALGGVGRVG